MPMSIITLVGLTLTATLLLRAGEGAVVTSGNISNRNVIHNVNDLAFATAHKWLMDNGATLNADNAAAGYWSSTSTLGSSVVWPANAPLVTDTTSGASSNYLIYRMCTATGAYNAPGNSCAMKDSGGVGAGNSLGYQGTAFTGGVTLMYKIIVRSIGAKGATSVSETVVSM